MDPRCWRPDLPSSCFFRNSCHCCISALGLGEHVLAALEQATDAVWVCGMDVPSIRGLRAGFHTSTNWASCRKAVMLCSTWPMAGAASPFRTWREQSGYRLTLPSPLPDPAVFDQ